MGSKKVVRVDVVSDAAAFLAAFDAGDMEGYVEKRTAEAIADFWVEHQFARIDWDCDWSDAKCREMYRRMVAALKALGV
jgi:hypothetical protein